MNKAEYTRETLPPLTKAQQDDLKRLAAMPDDGGDTDDMPELTAAQLAGMQQGVLYRPVKSRSRRGLMLTWLKAQGKGYQSHMNAILREAMLNTNSDRRY